MFCEQLKKLIFNTPKSSENIEGRYAAEKLWFQHKNSKIARFRVERLSERKMIWARAWIESLVGD